MAAVPQAGAAAPAGPRSGPSRLPVARRQEKRALSCGGREASAAGPPQPKRSRTGLGPGGARAAPKAAPKAAPRAPLRTLGPAAAAGKNDAPRKSASAAAASRAGAGPASARRAPWDVRGRLADAQAALGQARARLLELDAEKQRLESGNRGLSERLELLGRQLGDSQARERSLSQSVGSLESEVSRFRAELEQSRGRLEALEAEERRRRQERDEARSRAQALAEQLENTEAGLRRAQEQLRRAQEQLEAQRALEAAQRTQLAQREERIHALEMERRRLHNDVQELKGNIRVFCRVRPLLPAERLRQPGLPHLHFPPQDRRGLVLTRPDDVLAGGPRAAGGAALRLQLRPRLPAWSFPAGNLPGGPAPGAVGAGRFPGLHLRLRADGQRQDLHHGGPRGPGARRAPRHHPARRPPPLPGLRRPGGRGLAVSLLRQLPGDLQRGAARPAAAARPARRRAGDPAPGARRPRAARAQPHLGARGERGAGAGAAGAGGLAALGGAHGAQRALLALPLRLPAAPARRARRPPPALRLLPDPGGPGGLRAPGEVGLGGEPAPRDAEHQLQPQRPGAGHQRPLQQGGARAVPEQQTDLPAAELPGRPRQGADVCDHFPPGGEFRGVPELPALRQQGERVHDRHRPGQPEVTHPVPPTIPAFLTQRPIKIRLSAELIGCRCHVFFTAMAAPCFPPGRNAAR